MSIKSFKLTSPITRYLWMGLIASVVASAALTVAHYPRTVDALTPEDLSTASRDYRAFYEDSYASGSNTVDPKIEKSYNQRGGQESVRPQDDPHLAPVSDFVQRYGVSRLRVLEIGAGHGGLQDVVDNYTGLDISSNARRFFHKPFVMGSATSLPFRDNEFDAIWTIDTLEHVPKPELALVEMRRVLKDGGLLYLSPAWSCKSWFAEGYDARPYSDFNVTGKLIKASIPVRSSLPYRLLYTLPIRLLRAGAYKFSGKPTPFRYNTLKPNYTYYWEPDSDAVNSLDAYEATLWFTSRGDECLSPTSSLKRVLARSGEPVILRIHK